MPRHDHQQVTLDDIRSLAYATGLHLSAHRLEQLQRTLTAYLHGLDRLRSIDPNGAEPPAITYDSEYTA